MSDVAIRADGLSKKYQIGKIRPRSRTFGDALSHFISTPYRRFKNRRSTQSDEQGNSIWALKDVSFEIKYGEVVGIIGRNGAGKSTLLKILSRITEPTGGYADIHGRVGSLLEVGTGFHLDLTGRDNIYLNGSILGMRKNEIDRKLDEIVEFAGVGTFLDTAVKNYSSGMYLRLAFSVAAHLEPEILVVDEVLSVGDMEFQKKCMGKMEDVASQGRTVLFVSHNLGAVKTLCQTSMVLDGGRIDYRGSVVNGLIRYCERAGGTDDREMTGSRTGWSRVRIKGKDVTPGIIPTIHSGESFVVEATLDLREDYLSGKVFFLVENSAGTSIIHSTVSTGELVSGSLKAGRYRLEVALPTLWLAGGIYSLSFKFIGFRQTAKSSPYSGEDRRVSERINIDVVSDAIGSASAHLAPPAEWHMAPVLRKAAPQDIVSTVI
jgi:lipopolysaccharide transport system ATP-binding protein